LAKNVFRSQEVRVVEGKVNIPPPVFQHREESSQHQHAFQAQQLAPTDDDVEELTELGDEDEQEAGGAESPQHSGTHQHSGQPGERSAEQLQQEREEQQQQWEQERQQIIEEAQAEADRIVKDAENRAFEEVQSKNEQAQQIKQEAEDERERILKEAREEAERINTEAQERSQETEKEARERGYNEGHKEGFENGKGEAERLIGRLHVILNKAIERRNEIIDESEEQLVELVLQIAKKVVLVISEQQRNVVINNVIQALRKLKGKADVIIRVNLQDLEMTTEHTDEILDQVERVGNITVAEDSSVDPGGCIIETDFGEIDARISSQLREIEDRIRELTPIGEERPKGDGSRDRLGHGGAGDGSAGAGGRGYGSGGAGSGDYRSGSGGAGRSRSQQRRQDDQERERSHGASSEE
jgi:flagellar assembly protein FliH